MSTVNDVLSEIKAGLDQTSSSKKDEIRVMQAMLNDTTYSVGIYSKKGKEEDYSPSADARAMIANIVASTTGISKAEATAKAEKYEFTKTDATSMVNLSKEFVNTYVHCGRKLPFGHREKLNAAVSLKEVPATTKSYPKKVGVDKAGNPIYDHPTINVPGYEALRVYALK